MRRWYPFCVLWLALVSSHAEIIDRIAVSVGNKVITQADLDREIRITALLNGDKPDFSPANKRLAAGRMVDQRLVRTELEGTRYLLPTAADADTALDEIKSHFPDKAAYAQALANYGVSEEDLKARLLWQLTLVHFIDVRFRPGIQVTDDQIRKYLDEHVRPGLDLKDYRDTVEQQLIGEAANQQAEEWLTRARQRIRIEYHDEVFR